MADRNDNLLDHNYDGIQEYDNPLPGWWTALFWVTIAFAVGYWVYYHGMGSGDVRMDEYAAEMQEAEVKYARFKLPELNDDALAKLVADKTQTEKGAAVFKERCAVCHGDKAEGKIGPNLTDNAWLHGGKLSQIYKTIGNGVASKGMPAWRLTLKSEEVQAVSAFVGSIKNTKVAGKEPQGDVEPDVAPAAVPVPVPAPAPAPVPVPAPAPAPAPAAASPAGM